MSRVSFLGLLAALSLLAGTLGGCTVSTDQSAKTVTVPAPRASSPVAKSHNPRTSAATTAGAPSSPTFTKCDANIDVKASTTTCPFAENVFWEYWQSGESSSISAYSPAAHSAFSATCDTAGVQVVCRTSDDAVVRFPQSAVDNYSAGQADHYAATHNVGPDSEESSSPPTDPDGPATTAGENIPNYENGRGYRVQCEDGMYSKSGGIQGACSGHGGVR